MLVLTSLDCLSIANIVPKSKKGYPMTITVIGDKVEHSCGPDMDRYCYVVKTESSNIQGDIILHNNNLNCWIGSPENFSLSKGYINVILEQDYNFNSINPFIIKLTPNSQLIDNYNIWLNQINNLNNK